MPGSSRRGARSTALKALFAMDIGGRDMKEAVDEAVVEAKLSEDSKEFVQQIVAGVESRKSEIDAHISEVVTGYTIERLAAVDRCLLRLAVFELMDGTTPMPVVINEAIELAKKYSTEESGGFVNGVLSKIPARLRPEA